MSMETDFYMKALLSKLPKLEQRQDSVTDQLLDLIVVANHLGFQDAADYLREHVKK